jgi:hypothetical protein
MQIQGAPTWLSVGWIIGLLVLVAVFVLFITNQLALTEALLIGGLALARLIP